MSPAPWSHPPPDGKLILEKGSEEGNEIAYALLYVHQSKRGSMLCFESMWTRNTVLWQANAELFCPLRKLWLRFFSIWLKGLGLGAMAKYISYLSFTMHCYNWLQSYFYSFISLITIMVTLLQIGKENKLSPRKEISLWKYFKSSRA